MAFAKDNAMEIPVEVSQWIDGELAKAKRKTLMDFEAGEFFESDTARLIGYIKGYDRNAGFSTGMIYVKNEITKEDFPTVIQIDEDGRFEGVFPMNYPKYLYVDFNNMLIFFYIQPGQTLAMLLDWEDFSVENRLRNIRFQGVTADINNELSAFQAQLSDFPYRKIYEEMEGKNSNEFKSAYNECLSEYTEIFQRLLTTEKLSETSKAILRNNFQINYVSYLLDYEMYYAIEPGRLPLEFYDFLQDIPMDNKELLSTSEFSWFINRLEYCHPISFPQNYIKATTDTTTSQKSDYRSLLEKLNIPKTPEDEALLLLIDSINAKIFSQDMIVDITMTLKFVEEYNKACEQFEQRYRENEAYKKLKEEIKIKEWGQQDSIYTNELKCKQGVIYDLIKIRYLKSLTSKEEAWHLLNARISNVSEPFLRKEADRIFQKKFPEKERVAYELLDSYEAKIFKELIAPFKGRVVLVDFWATFCTPCVANIKNHKALREKYKDSPDVAFVFITSENESSSLEHYNKFVEEQGLTNSYRINADQYRYLRQLFRFNGIPRYILVDREGRILNDNLWFPSYETELIKAIEM